MKQTNTHMEKQTQVKKIVTNTNQSMTYMPRSDDKAPPLSPTQETLFLSPTSRCPVHGHNHTHFRLRRCHHRSQQPHNLGLLVLKHKDAVHRGEPQQGRDQVRRVQVHCHVPRNPIGQSLGSWVLPGGPQRQTGTGHHRR